MMRNSMGACTMVRVSRNARGRGGGRGFYPMTFSNPNPRIVYPASPVRSPFYPTQHYYDKRSPIPEVHIALEW